MLQSALGAVCGRSCFSLVRLLPPLPRARTRPVAPLRTPPSNRSLPSPDTRYTTQPRPDSSSRGRKSTSLRQEPSPQIHQPSPETVTTNFAKQEIDRPAKARVSCTRRAHRESTGRPTFLASPHPPLRCSSIRPGSARDARWSRPSGVASALIIVPPRTRRPAKYRAPRANPPPGRARLVACAL